MKRLLEWWRHERELLRAEAISTMHPEAVMDDCWRRRAEGSSRVERACEVMHDAYEQAAVEAGWETQPRSRVPWDEVPEANKVTMRKAVVALIEFLDADSR